MQLNKNPQLDALDKKAESSEKNILPDKKRKSWVGTLLRITFIYFPLGSIIVGALALPNLLSCGNKAKQSEAKQYVSSMNRAQQAYFAEKGVFATSLDALDLGLKSQTTNYNYSVIAGKKAAFSYGVARTVQKDTKSVVGAVFLVPAPLANGKKAADTSTIITILCIAKSDSPTPPAAPININRKLACGDGTVEVNK
ncbi:MULTISPECIES: type IV pilin-like G/H family protein [unclassified Microcoleus]|uniref:type IV pilin-like G/H family protein n=1 Tax=unclassified Microcoleus TaxID=2642155 RepID=UPI002FD1935B